MKYLALLFCVFIAVATAAYGQNTQGTLLGTWGFSNPTFRFEPNSFNFESQDISLYTHFCGGLGEAGNGFSGTIGNLAVLVGTHSASGDSASGFMYAVGDDQDQIGTFEIGTAAGRKGLAVNGTLFVNSDPPFNNQNSPGTERSFDEKRVASGGSFPTARQCLSADETAGPVDGTWWGYASPEEINTGEVPLSYGAKYSFCTRPNEDEGRSGETLVEGSAMFYYPPGTAADQNEWMSVYITGVSYDNGQTVSGSFETYKKANGEFVSGGQILLRSVSSTMILGHAWHNSGAYGGEVTMWRENSGVATQRQCGLSNPN